MKITKTRKMREKKNLYKSDKKSIESRLSMDLFQMKEIRYI